MPGSYVDNAMNRRLGRVGMPRGSMPVSRDGVFLPAKTYSDNSYNRSLGRDGLLHGENVVSRDDGHFDDFHLEYKIKMRQIELEHKLKLLELKRKTLPHCWVNARNFPASAGSSFDDYSNRHNPDPQGMRRSANFAPNNVSHLSGWLNDRSGIDIPQIDSFIEHKGIKFEDNQKWTKWRTKDDEDQHDRKYPYACNNIGFGMSPLSGERSQFEDNAKWTKWRTKDDEDQHDRKYPYSCNNLGFGMSPLSGERSQFAENNKWLNWRNSYEEDIQTQREETSLGCEPDMHQKPVYYFDTTSIGTNVQQLHIRDNHLTNSQEHGLDNTWRLQPEPQPPQTSAENQWELPDLNNRQLLNEVENIGPLLYNALSESSNDSLADSTTSVADNMLGDENTSIDSGIDVSWYGSPIPPLLEDKKLHQLRRRHEDSKVNIHKHSHLYHNSPKSKKQNALKSRMLTDHNCRKNKESTGSPAKAKTPATFKKTVKENQSKNPKNSLGIPKDDVGDESQYAIRQFNDAEIDFNEIQFIRKIHAGWFSEIHMAKWKGSVVTVKSLNCQRSFDRIFKSFMDEIFLHCELSHPNIVTFVGASIIAPNICIATEYMQTSLHESLHIKGIKFTESEKLKIIQQTALGLAYLHDSNIAHCNIASKNIVLNHTPSQTPVAKIADFSHSLKGETEIYVTREKVRNTASVSVYSSPEILRDDPLTVTYLKMADMYSYSLVIFEIITEVEPFANLDYFQLKENVCELGLKPTIPKHFSIEPLFLNLMQGCWDREPSRRPTAKQISTSTSEMGHIFISSVALPRYSWLYLIGIMAIFLFLYSLFFLYSFDW